MKLGIIGSGMIVQEFLPKLARLDGLEITAIQGTERSREQVEALCREAGVPHAVFSFGDLAALDIDTVYVAAPNFLHAACCAQALEAGLHVIVEKPITSNDAEAHALRQLAERHHRFLFEAVTTLYFPAFQKIREWLPRLGAVKIVQCSYSQYSRRYDRFRAGEILPAFDPEKSGGALMDLNLYNLHFVMGLFGRPESAVYYPNIERNIDTSGMMILRYPGFVASCTAAKDCSAPHFFVIEGTDGSIQMRRSPNLMGEVTLRLRDGTEERYDDGLSEERVIPEFRYFIDCIARQDWNACMAQLDKSIAVSEVQTRARLACGIVFAADQP